MGTKPDEKYLAGSLSCGISSTADGVIPAIGGNMMAQLLSAEEERLVWWNGAEVSRCCVHGMRKGGRSGQH